MTPRAPLLHIAPPTANVAAVAWRIVAQAASQASIEEPGARVQRNEQMAAVLEMGKLNLHDMDDGLNAGTVDASYAPNTRTAIRLLALTNWGDQFQEDADIVREHAVDLLKALEDENVTEAARHATELHELGHDFTEAVWAELAQDLPADAGGVEAHDDSAGETPAAGETPEGDDHSEGEKTPAAAATP